MIATQAEVDALTTKVSEIEGQVATAKQSIEAEFNALEKQIGEGAKTAELDLTKLDTAIASLGVATGELEELKPTTSTPAQETPAEAEARAKAKAEEEARKNV